MASGPTRTWHAVHLSQVADAHRYTGQTGAQPQALEAQGEPLRPQLCSQNLPSSNTQLSCPRGL